MARLLFLPHRMPYPPDKGDKIRSYHLLRHLASRHEVSLATFIDDPADEAHIDTVRAFCVEAHFARLQPTWARVRSLAACLSGEALTQRYYRDHALMCWVLEKAKARPFDATIVFSSSMAQYAQPLRDTAMLLDLVDVDSAKWSALALRRRWPLSWLLGREGQQLLELEKHAVSDARYSFLCTEQERDLFESLAPELKGRVDVLRNGVDADFYSPDPSRASPFAPGELPIVFTGAMDYWPNVDAVAWFAQAVMPQLRRKFPAARFHIVGRNPTPAVRDLAGAAVNVTGTVPDVRPFLQHAAAVVAPLRVARGIQNKILEAMAMGRPVLAAEVCGAALQARAGEDLLTASDESGYLATLERLLSDAAWAGAVGAAGRRCVLDTYSWPSSLLRLDQRLDEALRRAPSSGRNPAAPTVALGET